MSIGTIALTERLKLLFSGRAIFRTPTAVAAIVAVSLFALYLAWTWTDQAPKKSVVAEWTDSIAQLGIEPVYPPQEDITVGDLYYVVTKDNADQEKISTTLISRSIKVDHIDMSLEIAAYLNDLYSFPETTPRPRDLKDPWKQAPFDPKTFMHDRIRTSLPVVLFPGITIARTREASASFAGKLHGFAVQLGLTHDELESIDLKVPFAETYGTTSIVATKRLVRYCTDPASKSACSERAMRNQLSMVVGDEIHKPLPHSNKYRYDCELVLIDRVYMVRAIDATADNEFKSVFEKDSLCGCGVIHRVSV